MPLLRRKVIDSTTEKRILTGLITSTKFLKEVYPQIDYSYFKNSYIEKVARWISDYYETYELAPKQEIESIFEKNKDFTYSHFPLLYPCIDSK